MARIEAEATRMGVLVEDLLLLAQLDQIPEPRRVPVDLRELAEHAAQDTRVVAPEREIELEAAPDEVARARGPRPAAPAAGQPVAQRRHPHAGRSPIRAATDGRWALGACSRCATTGRACRRAPASGCSIASGAPRAAEPRARRRRSGAGDRAGDRGRPRRERQRRQWRRGRSGLPGSAAAGRG